MLKQDLDFLNLRLYPYCVAALLIINRTRRQKDHGIMSPVDRDPPDKIMQTKVNQLNTSCSLSITLSFLSCKSSHQYSFSSVAHP